MIDHFTTWAKSLHKGKVKEKIFQEDFMDYLNIGYIDVSGDPAEQKRDIDFLVKCLESIDVKPYNDNGYVSIEEDSVVETKKRGWIYTSDAKYFAFVSTQTRTILVLRNDDSFQEWWQQNRQKFLLKKNQTTRGTDIWHSTYRNVPLKRLNIAWYKKNKQYLHPKLNLC